MLLYVFSRCLPRTFFLNHQISNWKLINSPYFMLSVVKADSITPTLRKCFNSSSEVPQQTNEIMAALPTNAIQSLPPCISKSPNHLIYF